MIAKMISPGQMVYIKKPIEKATDIAATNGAKQENEKTEKIKKKKKNKRLLNVHPALMRVAKAASTIGASFVIVSAVGSYATGARDVRDLQRAARNVQKTTVSVAMFIGKTWKSMSKNLIPGVTDEVPTLTPTVVYQRTPNKVVKRRSFYDRIKSVSSQDRLGKISDERTGADKRRRREEKRREEKRRG